MDKLYHEVHNHKPRSFDSFIFVYNGHGYDNGIILSDGSRDMKHLCPKKLTT